MIDMGNDGNIAYFCHAIYRIEKSLQNYGKLQQDIFRNISKKGKGWRNLDEVIILRVLRSDKRYILFARDRH